MEKKWKDILNYEGFYQISNFGEVKSLERMVIGRNGSTRLVKSRLLKIGKDRYGYPQITLNKNGYKKCFRIHQLVALHFIERENELNFEVHHKDHNKSNCHFSNLEWATKETNIRESMKFHGKRIEKACKYCHEIFEVRKASKQKFCSQKCANLHKNTVERPSKELLTSLVKANTIVGISKMYGVSDNSIRKWCKSYGVDYKKNKTILSNKNSNNSS